VIQIHTQGAEVQRYAKDGVFVKSISLDVSQPTAFLFYKPYNAESAQYVSSGRVLRGVAGCCGVLQGVAGCSRGVVGCCGVLRGVAGCCRVLQNVATEM